MTVAERQHASSGCKGSVKNDWADLACNLWPHDDDPTASHWDADAGVWWQTDDQRKMHVEHNRQMSRYAALVSAEDVAAIDRLAAVAREMLASFKATGDGHRARVGQVQIAKWQERIEGGTDD